MGRANGPALAAKSAQRLVCVAANDRDPRDASKPTPQVDGFAFAQPVLHPLNTSVPRPKHRRATCCVIEPKPAASGFSRLAQASQHRRRRYIRLIYPLPQRQQDAGAHQQGASSKQETTMFTKTMIALCTSA